MRAFILAHWYRARLSWFSVLLLPLAWVFRVIIFLRQKFIQSHRCALPVIIVGNITVGGTGKTPFIIWLADFLSRQGFKPGILTRGVGGVEPKLPHRVLTSDSVTAIGDEAKLLSIRCHAPIIICQNRLAGARALSQTECDIIICDDGLQHYQLQRDIEILMVDSQRKFGNQQLLPAGPLREPVTRLKTVDLVVSHPLAEADQYAMHWLCHDLVSLTQGHKIPLQQLAHKSVIAMAGIGHPQRFFDVLKQHHLQIQPKIFPDHYAYQRQDLDFDSQLPVIMTQKDAVKCQTFENLSNNLWYLPVSVSLPQTFENALMNLIQKKCHNHVLNKEKKEEGLP